MPYKRTERVSRRLEQKQHSLVQAAVQLFEEKGFEQVTVKDISRLAGLATGTFYLYFRNKDSLFSTLLEEYFGRLVDEIEVARNASDGTIPGKLRASMVAVLGFFAARRGLARLALVQLVSSKPGLSEEVAGIQAELAKMIAADLEEAREEGLIPWQDCYLTAEVMVGCFYQVIINWLRCPGVSDLTDTAGPLVDFALRGAGFDLV